MAICKSSNLAGLEKRHELWLVTLALWLDRASSSLAFLGRTRSAVAGYAHAPGLQLAPLPWSFSSSSPLSPGPSSRASTQHSIVGFCADIGRPYDVRCLCSIRHSLFLLSVFRLLLLRTDRSPGTYQHLDPERRGANVRQPRRHLFLPFQHRQPDGLAMVFCGACNHR